MKTAARTSHTKNKAEKIDQKRKYFYRLQFIAVIKIYKEQRKKKEK